MLLVNMVKTLEENLNKNFKEFTKLSEDVSIAQ